MPDARGCAGPAREAARKRDNPTRARGSRSPRPRCTCLCKPTMSRDAAPPALPNPDFPSSISDCLDLGAKQLEYCQATRGCQALMPLCRHARPRTHAGVRRRWMKRAALIAGPTLWCSPVSLVRRLGRCRRHVPPLLFFIIHAPRGATGAERSCCVLERRRPPLLSLDPLKRRKCACDAFICREARKSPETA